MLALPTEQSQIPPSLLQRLPIPKGKWTHIAMDFITGLSSTNKGQDSIYVVVDKMIQHAYLISTKTRYLASQVAWQFH